MSEAFRASLNRAPERKAWIRAELSAGAPLGFFIVADDDARTLSHVVQRVGRHYLVTGTDDELLGSFHTQAGATAAGFAASATLLDHGL